MILLFLFKKIRVFYFNFYISIIIIFSFSLVMFSFFFQIFISYGIGMEYGLILLLDPCRHLEPCLQYPVKEANHFNSNYQLKNSKYCSIDQ